MGHVMAHLPECPFPHLRARTALACTIVYLSLLPARSTELPQVRSQPPDYAAELGALGEGLEDLLQDEKVAGAAIVAVEGDRIVWSRHLGYAHRGESRRVVAGTRFQAGDMSKALTAVAVLQQVEAGRFALDDPMDRLLPNIAWEKADPDWPAPTVRQLLTHHGGVAAAPLAGSYLDTPPSALNPVAKVEMVQRPGQVFAYTHQGYALLGLLIEKSSGQPYPDYVRQRILLPLGMKEAGFGIQDGDAWGHNKRRRAEPNLYARDLPALGLMASAEDLARFMSWTVSDDPRPVLSRRGVDEMIRAHNLDVALDLENHQGLAWQLTNTGRHRVEKVLRLNTSTIHFRGVMLAAPRERLGVVVLANGSPAIDFTIEAGRSTLDALLQARFGIEPPSRELDIPDRIPLAPGARDMPMAGRYVTALGLVEFNGDAERHDMDFLGRSFRARRRDDGWYEVTYRLLGLIELRFSLLDDILIRPVRLDGHEVLLGWYQNAQFLFGTALPPGLAEGDRDLAGRYELLNADALSRSLDLEDIRLEFRDGLLLASYRLPLFITLRPRLPLVRINGHRYQVPGLGTNLGEWVHIDPDTDELTFSGYRFRRDN